MRMFNGLEISTVRSKCFIFAFGLVRQDSIITIKRGQSGADKNTYYFYFNAGSSPVRFIAILYYEKGEFNSLVRVVILFFIDYDLVRSYIIKYLFTGLEKHYY